MSVANIVANDRFQSVTRTTSGFGKVSGIPPKNSKHYQQNPRDRAGWGCGQETLPNSGVDISPDFAYDSCPTTSSITAQQILEAYTLATNDHPDGILLTLTRYVLNIVTVVGGIVLVAGLLFILVTRAKPQPPIAEGQGQSAQAPAPPTATKPAPTAAPTEAPTAAPAAAGAEVIAMGEELFTSQGCVGCHTIEGVSQGVVGPDLTAIGDEAGARAQEVGAADAAAYLHESIVDPNAFVAPECPTGPCPPGTMPANFGKILTDEQINALVQFLLSQKGGG